MDEVAGQGIRQKESHMPLPDTEESNFPHTEEQSLVQHVTSFEEWRALASAWPMKQLVSLWNDLPGVVPVQKFTNREIALERIWRSVHGSEGTGNQSRREQKNPFREGSKAAQVYALLGRPEGAAENKVEQSVDQRSKRVMTTWPTGLGKTVLFSALPDTL